MGEFDVHQRTKDGMFNATTLLKQWNLNNPNEIKEKVSVFFRNDNTKDFIKVLEEDLHGHNFTHVTSKASRGMNAGTWMHPYLFIKFAMWLNPKFELSVIKFVYDELIKNRHDAGDNYKLLSKSGVKLKGYNFSEVATAMNWIVFNKKGKGLRQNASKGQLQELTDIQTKLSFAIDMGYIKTYKKLLSEMRELYKRKTPF